MIFIQQIQSHSPKYLQLALNHQQISYGQQYVLLFLIIFYCKRSFIIYSKLFYNTNNIYSFL